MKKVILLSAALLAMTAVAANAQLRLALDDCNSGNQEASWACATNTGTTFMAVASVIAPPLVTLTGEQGVVDIAFATAVPDWWKFGGCRVIGSLAVSFTSGSNYSCVDYFGSMASSPSGGSFYTIGPGSDTEGPVDANRARIRTVSAVNGDEAAVATQPAVGDEIYLFNFTVNKARTVGTPSCAGCSEPACIVFKKAILTQPVGVGDYTFEVPTSYGFVTVQGGAGTDCPNVTPTSRSSWGQVKSLYR